MRSMGFFENLWANLTVPFEIATVFNAMRDIFDAFPLVVKFTLIGCFSLACVFAVLRMLT